MARGGDSSPPGLGSESCLHFCPGADRAFLKTNALNRVPRSHPREHWPRKAVDGADRTDWEPGRAGPGVPCFLCI